MKPLELEILAIDKTFYKGETENVIIPAIDGKIGILADHVPAVIAVKAGELEYKVNGEWQKAVVSSGVAEIIDNKLTVLVDSVERPEDIDLRRAEESKQRAEEKLAHKQSLMQYHQSKAALSRAMVRLRAGQKHDRI